MKTPDPLVIAWRGQHLRVRHDDAPLSPYSPRGATIRSAVELASGVEGLLLATTVGDRYRVKVSDGGSVVDCGVDKREVTASKAPAITMGVDSGNATQDGVWRDRDEQSEATGAQERPAPRGTGLGLRCPLATPRDSPG